MKSLILTVLLQHAGYTFTMPIMPFVGDIPIEDFYAYEAVYETSTDLPQGEEDVSVLFFYYDTMNGELSLVIIHDKAQGSGDTTDGGLATIAVSNIRPGWLSIQDDPGGSGGLGDTWVITEDFVSFRARWFECCTDGLAITWDTLPACPSVYAKFYFGITRWVALSADGSRYTLTPEVPLNMCFNCTEVEVGNSLRGYRDDTLAYFSWAGIGTKYQISRGTQKGRFARSGVVDQNTWVDEPDPDLTFYQVEKKTCIE